ncbi:hypothetical protein FBZ93_1287 [Bradyrhizobium macuxiense]|uniref:Cytochrome c domain-containing protein n=1 Tax=Bradyrhizobium macuxiense TaxID=1755647 RepID=A0A560KUH5_9BRAD|nr:hypothetical protein [Bradyrhizobium macuxiense]TWB86767.1 hypothetical protein FBZ93_1287 [Bradyrhizobium macuxiense]
MALKPRHLVVVAIAMAALPALVVGTVFATEDSFGWRPLFERTMRLATQQKADPGELAHILVETGDAATADKYYARIGQKIGFDIQASKLDGLLEYLGYRGLRAVDLETLEPALLMPRDQQGLVALGNAVESPKDFKANAALTVDAFKSDILLVARFFAPKIVDFNANPDKTPGHDLHKPGWRKVVRLKALPKSAASVKGDMESAYILFNFFQDDPKAFPFSKKSSDGTTLINQSVNNQIIMVPRTFKKEVEDSVYYLDYQPFSVDRYKVGKALNAAFDTLDPKSSKQDYFVPTACSQCHGHDTERGGPSDKGTFPFGKVNYLDTDQWYDMMDFDFPATKANHDVLFDGGRDHAAAQYKAAVGVLWKLNSEIAQQNSKATHPDGSDAFKINAVKKWLSLHGRGEGPADILQRSIGSSRWGSADRPLLQMLSRYCFRCHSSMYYDVFDRSAVVKEKGSPKHPGPILTYVQSGFMPQGRKLDSTEKDKLLQLLKDLH